MIGGMDFDAVKLEDFLFKLAAKHPDVTIVTGNGKGAEAIVKSTAESIGITVEQPALRDDLYGKAALGCQINDVLIGADVIVLIGSPSGTRPKIAADIHKRIDFKHHLSTREVRQLHVIAQNPAKPKAAVGRKQDAKKKRASAANQLAA
jgi:hypothetical protein